MFRDFLNPYGRYFRAQGWRVDAMACDALESPECRSSFDSIWNVNWSRNPLAPRNMTHIPRDLRAIVREADYDIVHVHTPVPGFVTRCALRRLRQSGRPKIIYTAHGFHFHPEGRFAMNLMFAGLEKIAGRWTDYLVVINRADELSALAYGLVSSKRLVYMPGIGVDTEYYKSAAVGHAQVKQVREELGLRTGEHVFLMIAEFRAGKRHRDALRAFARLNDPAAYLAFAGTGPLMDAVARLARELGIAGRVKFLGFRRDIPALIRASVAVVLPSEREGLPRSIMEALLLEVPVIGTDVRGTRDLVSGGGGILVQLGNHGQLCDALRRVLQDPGDARRLVRGARERMEQYDLRHIIQLHEKLYDQALADSRVPAASTGVQFSIPRQSS